MRRHRRLAFLLTATIAAGMIAPPAFAGEGVVEINRAAALAGNVTPGDTAGFPVTLSQAGSYVLTGDLVMSPSDGSTNTSVVQITADDVTLDLNGFEIAQWQTCTPAAPAPPTSCSIGGSGVGVSASGRNNVTVRNGTVHNTISLGLVLGARCRVENVHVEETGLFGVSCGNDSRVRNTSGRRNLTKAISIGERSVIRDSIATSNGFDGISVSRGSLLQRNISSANPNKGIESINEGSLIVGNVAHGNLLGILMHLRDGYVDNASTGNSSSAVSGGATQIGGNLCNSAPC